MVRQCWLPNYRAATTPTNPAMRTPTETRPVSRGPAFCEAVPEVVEEELELLVVADPDETEVVVVPPAVVVRLEPEPVPPVVVLQ